MSGIPLWFDITATDASVTRRFYAELFGWEIAVDEALDYGLVSDGNAPTGGIGQTGEGNQHPPGVVIYFPVGDVEAAVATAREHGADLVVAPWEVPGLGRMAVITDPEGNRIGVMSR